MEGTPQIDILMIPVMKAIKKHVKDRDAQTEIYNRAYEAIQISMDVTPKEANSLLRSAYSIASRNGEQTNWDAFKNEVYKELVEEHKIKNSPDNNEPSDNDVSVTQDVLINIKKSEDL